MEQQRPANNAAQAQAEIAARIKNERLERDKAIAEAKKEIRRAEAAIQFTIVARNKYEYQNGEVLINQ